MCIYPCNTYSKVVWRRIYTFITGIIIEMCAGVQSSFRANNHNIGSQYFHTFFIFLQRFSFFCLSISSKLYTTGIVPRVHRSSSVAYQTGVIGDWRWATSIQTKASPASHKYMDSPQCYVHAVRYNIKCILIGHSHFLNCQIASIIF